MNSDDSPLERDPLELLADEFASRCRQGDSPSVDEYAAKHPEFARQIEELFPAVALMEQLRVEEEARRDAASRRAEPVRPPEYMGDFHIIQEIGRGGMGIVYEAEQRSLARRVAVKVLPRHTLLLDKHLKRFQREAQTAARLLHTNIVPVFGAGQQDGLHYYVMPLVRGVGLDEVIQELRAAGEPAHSPVHDAGQPAAKSIPTVVRALIAGKFGKTLRACEKTGTGSEQGRCSSADTASDEVPVPIFSHPLSAARQTQTEAASRTRPRASHWRTAADIGLQAADALDYAHGQGTLHRDIKPANILLDSEGVVSVADFGLARAVDQADSSRSGEVVGTPRYMAPEQLTGTADARSDVYALGLTLYELVTLRPAFDEAAGRRSPHAGREPSAPRKIDPAIPRDLETIILKCLAHEPSKRYQAAADLAADLRCFLEDRPIRARRASFVERAWRWRRRNPALAAMSAVAALLLVAVAGIASTGYLRTRDAYTEATRALGRAESTSRLSLDVLDAIYLQLSPDRVWISSDSANGAEACPCLGLRSGERSLSVRPSQETASLLENLLVFYDRLARQGGDDYRVLLESAIASRRVGDIRQRLGRLHEAENQYTKAVEKLAALRSRPEADERVPIELARTYNEIGNVRATRREQAQAFESHQQALSVLRSCDETRSRSETHRYELARTLYFLSNKPAGAASAGNRRGPSAPRSSQAGGSQYRASAVAILEELVRQQPDAPDYRFLLALCYRPSGAGPVPAWPGPSVQGRDRAIRILETLKSQYPEVADYRYELVATYAWVPVALFPWQTQTRPAASPSAEQSLRQALDESQWLVAHYPAIPQYACSQALILAKLGMICWTTGRLAEAEDCLQQAQEIQSHVTAEFPDLPPHDRVLAEFMRLRLAQVRAERASHTHDTAALRQSRDLLETVAADLGTLIQRAELADDRLAQSSLPVARNALRDLLARTGASAGTSVPGPGADR